MPTYDIQTPSGKIVTVEADTPEAAMGGAQQWHAQIAAGKPWEKYAPQPVAPGTPAPGTGPWTRYGPPPEQPSAVADITKSAGTGLIKGAVGLAGLPGTLADVADAAAAAPGRLWNKLAGSGKYEDTPSMIEGRRLDSERPHIGIDAVFNPKNTRAALESVTGPLYEPKTTAGHYAETIGEFAPNALIGPGGIVGKIVGDVVAPAVASEFTGQYTKGTAAEPYARIAGGLVGNVPAVIARARTSAPERAVAIGTRGTTPEQWDAAQALQDRGAALGVPLTGPEALAQATGGAVSKPTDTLRTVEGSTHGGAVTAPFFAQRPDQVETAVGRALDTIGTQDRRPSTLGPRAAETAQGALDTTRRDINVATAPAYRAAEAHVLDPADYAVVADQPGFAHSLERLRRDPDLGPQYANMPDNSVGVIDAVTKDMKARGQAAQNSANEGFNPQKGALVSQGAVEARDIARDPARGGVQAYDDALTAQEQARRQNLNPLEQGPLGKVAESAGGRGTLNSTQAASDAIMPATPLTGGQGEIQDAVTRLVAQSAVSDPGLAHALVRQGLADKFDQAAARVQGGRNQYVGAKFRNDVAGTPQQEVNLTAALDGLRSNNRPVGALADMFDVLSATGMRKPQGSPTSFNAETMRDLGEGPLVARAVTQSPWSATKEGAHRYFLGRSAGRLADMFIAPDSVQQMRAIAERGGPRSAIADMFLRAAVDAGAARGRIPD